MGEPWRLHPDLNIGTVACSYCSKNVEKICNKKSLKFIFCVLVILSKELSIPNMLIIIIIFMMLHSIHIIFPFFPISHRATLKLVSDFPIQCLACSGAIIHFTTCRASTKFMSSGLRSSTVSMGAKPEAIWRRMGRKPFHKELVGDMKLRWRNIAAKITEERTSTSLQKPVYRMKMMLMLMVIVLVMVMVMLTSILIIMVKKGKVYRWLLLCMWYYRFCSHRRRIRRFGRYGRRGNYSLFGLCNVNYAPSLITFLSLLHKGYLVLLLWLLHHHNMHTMSC